MALKQSNIITKNNQIILNIGTLEFKELNLKKNETHLLRGFIGNLFKRYDLIHNHDLKTGKEIYRYPLFQYRIINKNPLIVAITKDAIDILGELTVKTKELKIKDKILPVYSKNIELKQFNFGVSESFITYKFENPWIALNQQNYKYYMDLVSEDEKEIFLKKCLIANIISISKAFNYQVEEQIQCQLNLNQIVVNLKGNKILGFTGYFKVNFELPDLIGIGKSVSRGYGCIKRII
ncbi:DNA repair protein [bacterium]|nr:DNA repair protein [bacterium]